MPLQLHAAVTEMEQEKFELQKKHTQNIQELLEDTNIRLAKMESDYNARSQATVSTETGMCESGCVCMCQLYCINTAAKINLTNIVSCFFFWLSVNLCTMCTNSMLMKHVGVTHP